MAKIFKEVKNLYRIIELNTFRKTPGVSFDLVPLEELNHIDSIDRVIHDNQAVSPGPVGEVDRPWYMHEHQDDNLIVLHGKRNVDIYSLEHGEIEYFVVMPDAIYHNGALVFEGSAMLVWPHHVFHRIISGEEGSASINLAVHHKGFDIKTNFNIYDLNPKTGEYHVVRKGFKDQS